MGSARQRVIAIALVAVMSATAHAQNTPVPSQEPGQSAPSPSAQPQQPQQPQQPAPGSSSGTPQGPYVAGQAGVAAPRVLREEKPSYTPEAMRARIEGLVRLRGIVERDGTISNVEVVQSLDSMYGLDRAAVTALQQWRFQPGTVNGQPVRVLVNVEMRFALRTDTPAQTWPTGSSTPPAPLRTADEDLDTGGLRIRIPRPVEWTVQRGGPAPEAISVTSADGLEIVSVRQSAAGGARLQYPVTATLLQQIAESVRRAQPVDMAPETLDVGQVHGAGGSFWVWSLMRLTNVPAPAAAGTPDQNPTGDARVWTFWHTVDDIPVSVSCQLLLPRNLPASAVDTRVQRAASDCSAIVNGIAIEKVPQ